MVVVDATVDQTTITSPETGEIIYDNVIGRFFGYDGTSWQILN